MGKPFKLSTPATEIARRTDGKFTKVVAPLPAQVIAKYGAAEGVTNGEAGRAARVPMSDVGTGSPKDVGGTGSPAPAPVYPPALPWPEAGPFNDAGRKPFRFMR